MRERDYFKEADIDGGNNIKTDPKEIGWQRVN
jgi:hypothetical protein